MWLNIKILIKIIIRKFVTTIIIIIIIIILNTGIKVTLKDWISFKLTGKELFINIRKKFTIIDKMNQKLKYWYLR